LPWLNGHNECVAFPFIRLQTDVSQLVLHGPGWHRSCRFLFSATTIGTWAALHGWRARGLRLHANIRCHHQHHNIRALGATARMDENAHARVSRKVIGAVFVLDLVSTDILGDTARFAPSHISMFE
jgi:hypothetical protein